jgi:signal peptidase II
VKQGSRIAILVLVLIVCVGCDQATKAIARTSLPRSEAIVLANGMITLEYAENPGAFLGMGATLPERVRYPLSIAATGVLIVVATVFVLKTPQITLPQLVSLSFLIAGGIGNLIDRVLNGGAVVDFCVLSAGPLHTGIFNVADVAIVFGALAFALLSLTDNRVDDHAGEAEPGPAP